MPPSKGEPLHAQKPTERFSDRAGDYAKYRPSYPVAAIDAILAELPGTGPRLIADVGAGTGISSRLLADRAAAHADTRGTRVIAVEPNAAMRDAAATHAMVLWQWGSAERTGLADGAVHGIVCAQAFHWFTPEPTLAEFRRVLIPGGVVALLWNERDDMDEFSHAYGRLIVEASNGHPAAQRVDHHEPLKRSSLFIGFNEQSFASEQSLDLEGLYGRARSSSYCPQAGPAWEALRDGLSEIHALFAGSDGRVTLRYRAQVYTAHSSV